MVVDVLASSDLLGTATESLERDGRVVSRSCWISLRERERPVPSYPLIVDARKTRYGPIRLRTSGKGMAAASSMITSSAWPRTCASSGCMYYHPSL